MEKMPCDINAKEIKRLEERVDKLEQQREKDKEQLFELDKSLSGFIAEMKHISTDLKSVVSNFKEAIMRSTNAQEKELGHLKETVVAQGQQIKALETKLEHETVEKDAKKWNDTVKQVLTIVISAIVGIVLTMIGLK